TGAGLWCRACDEPVCRENGVLIHAATGQARGADGHLAAASATDPELKAEAAQIQADYSGLFKLTASLGFLRGLGGPAPRATAVHYEARDGGEMRGKLDAALASASLTAGTK
ncbi:MAG TPA: hypothetical protein VF482_10245, partial [Trebonia sp.]